MAKYQGQDVTVVRDANQNDPGFDPNKSDQVVIRLADGSERVVQRNELTDK